MKEIVAIKQRREEEKDRGKICEKDLPITNLFNPLYDKYLAPKSVVFIENRLDW